MNECEPIKYWANQIPAPETKKRLEEGDKRFNSLDLCLNDMKNQIEQFSKEMKEWKTENSDQHKELMEAIKEIKTGSANKNVEYIVYSILVIFALASLYFIFDRVGLPR